MSFAGEFNTTAVVVCTLVLGITLVATYLAAKRTQSTADYWAAGRGISGRANGAAIAGDFLSSSSLLGYAGLAFLFGMDGFLTAVAASGIFLMVLFLLAEKMRNLGKFTFADALALRLDQRRAKSTAAVSTLFVCVLYLLAQLVGAGVLVEALTGVDFTVGVVAAGVLMLIYVLFGGMLATTWVQIIKAILLMATTAALVVVLLWQVGFNPLAVLTGAVANSADGESFLRPGLYYNGPLDLLSMGVAVTLAAVGLPHVLMRFFTVPNAKQARTSTIWAIGLIGTFNILIVFLGLGARALLGSDAEQLVGKGGNLVLPLLASELGGGAGTTGGDLLLALITAIAFTTILAVTAGLVLSASSAVAHDLWTNLLRRDESEEPTVGRVAAVVVVAVAMLISIGIGSGVNVTILALIAASAAASANFPVLLLTLTWRGMRTSGAVTGALLGLSSALVLTWLSPAMWPGGPESAPWPLNYPVLLSVPLGFLGCWLGSVLNRRDPGDGAGFDRLQVRALTGIGAEQPSVH